MRGRKSLFITLFVVLGALLAGGYSALAQEAFGGTPPSFAASTSLLRSGQLTPNVVRVRPDFNPEDAKATDMWSSTHGDISVKPLQIGRVIDQEIDFIKAARKSEVDGRTVYTLRIESEGAKGMVLYYDDFFIPEGSGELFIYTPDRVEVLGAYTHATHPEHGAFANEPLPGDAVIMEFAPYLGADDSLLPSIKISGVGHIYRAATLGKLRAQEDPGEDASDPTCQIDINCPEGNNWQTQKSSVAQMIMVIGRDMGICTGSLLNNTNVDFKPYILSAAHCIGSSRVPQTDLDQWMFTFHYEKPGCSKAGVGVTRGRTAVGCKLRTFIDIQGKSDGLLLELKNEVPKAFRVYYSGWDHSARIPSKVTGIHHPHGDAKKISYCDGYIKVDQWSSRDGVGAPNAHFGFQYTKGDTEGGSSGSPLFNENGLIVGSLTGGAPGCGTYDAYGRLHYHWNKFKQSGSTLYSMDTFLDPKNTGEETLQGTWRDNLRPLEAVSDLKVGLSEDAKTVNVTWKPVSTANIPSHWTVKYRIYRNGMYLDGKDVTSGTSFSESVEDARSNTRGEGHVVYAVQARYLYGGDKLPGDSYNNGRDYTFGDADKVQKGLYLGDVKRVMPATVSAKANGGVNISWKKPGNLQEISLFGYPNVEKPIKLNFRQIDFGGYTGVPARMQLFSKFRADEMVNPDNSPVYISSVSVIPTAKTGTLKAFIINGSPASTKKEFPINMPDNWKEGEWVTVDLAKPYKIDPNQYLFAGVSYDNKSEKLPVKICYMSGTADEFSPYRGAFLSYMIGGEFGFFPLSAAGVYANGYLAVRLTLSPSAVKYTNDAEKSVFVRSNTPVPFPVIKGYRIKKNGAVLKEVDKNVNFITDNDGSSDDAYEIEVLYEDPTNADAPELSPAVAPSVYPSQLAADGVLNIANAERVQRIAVYTVDGKQVFSMDRPASQIVLGHLAEGAYIVVLATENGNITERVFR